MDEKNAVKIEH